MNPVLSISSPGFQKSSPGFVKYQSGFFSSPGPGFSPVRIFFESGSESSPGFEVCRHDTDIKGTTVYITLSELHFYKTEVNFTITESSARSLGVWRDVINAYNRFVICTSLLYCTASLLYLERVFSRLCNLHKFALF